MGCINDKNLDARSKRQHLHTKLQYSQNPIIRIAKQWNIDTIKQRWHDNQFDIIEHKLGQDVKKISKQHFLYLLPALKSLSNISQSNFYNLFNFQQEDFLSIQNFVTTLIIILKSDDYELLADMFFFAYSNSPSKDILNQKDFNLFRKQFKQYQLQFLHQTINPQRNQKGELYVEKKLFRDIFQQYDIKNIKTLFSFNIVEEERNFQKQLASQAIDRITDQKVFLIDFKWFLKWKKYIESKYGIRIKIKDNGKDLQKQKLNLLITAAQENQKNRRSRKHSIDFENNLIQQHFQPVNNDRIQGEDQNELKENLIQFSDFISVPQDIWQQIRIIYGGGPQIYKPYPHFYNKRIVLTILNQHKCRFLQGIAKAMVYDPKQTFEDIYKKRQQKYFLKDSVQNMVIFYKHPGDLEWKKIEKLNTKLGDFSFKFKTFVVFVRKNVVQQFQSNFNITEIKGKKQIKERIKNYGNLLTFQYQGILQQGHVGVILQHSVLIYLKNSKGQYIKIQKAFKELKKLNQSILDDQILQGFAGLENIGNTCYINAPLQCLLKTPYFDEYLESVNLQKSHKDLLTFQLHSLHQQSKKSRDCVNMANFKKTFDEKFPFFQGSAQHDAQQFLLLLLDRLSEEQPRESLIDHNQLKVNKKIHSIFSGKTKAETQCLKCHKKGYSEQSFFTYSLSLPIIKQTLFSFYHIDQSFKVRKYGLTINKDWDVQTVLRKIQNQLKTNSKNLLIMSVFQSSWYNDIQKLDDSYKIGKFEQYDSSIVCYTVQKQDYPEYEDMVEKNTKNSVKLQIRNRIFDKRSKTFRSSYFPFYIQVDYKMTGLQLREKITQKIKKFVNYDEYNSYKQFEKQGQGSKASLLEINCPSKNIISTTSIPSINQEEEELHFTKRNSKKKITDLPFYIQYLKNEENMKSICWFCKKNIDHSGQNPNPQTDCEGCQFPDMIPLYENKIFMKNFKNLVLTIDWKSEMFSKNWNIVETQSFLQARKQQKSRRTNLQKLMNESYNQEEPIQLRCQDENCRNNNAIRKQKIIQAPNILILHLKRFYYSDNKFYKLKNKVDIPEQFSLPGFSERYELYGSVVHSGNGEGRGGHYINYVKVSNRWYKCDDQKVTFTKQSSEHLNPDTYILFYKRKLMDKSWSFFGF